MELVLNRRWWEVGAHCRDIARIRFQVAVERPVVLKWKLYLQPCQEESFIWKTGVHHKDLKKKRTDRNVFHYYILHLKFATCLLPSQGHCLSKVTYAYDWAVCTVTGNLRWSCGYLLFATPAFLIPSSNSSNLHLGAYPPHHPQASDNYFLILL